MLAINIGYNALGPIANDSKFTLCCEQFLRVELTDWLSGYSCALPLQYQHRSWYARPVMHEAGLEHVLKTMAMLMSIVE